MRIDRIALLLTGLSLAVLPGCSERREEIAYPDIHPDAWMDPASPDFHGVRVLAAGTDFCDECHGEDAQGGARAVSCYTCHDSENECASCHGGLDNSTGAPPSDLSGNTTIDVIGVGAHTVHVEGEGGMPGFACNSCHTVPTTQASSGHQDSPLPAEVTFDESVIVTRLAASWDRDAMTCRGLVCHGAENVTPLWTEDHPFECWECHGDPDREIVAPSTFDPRSAPPTDLNGDTNTAAHGVGAHVSHVTTGDLRVGIDCVECHEKPENVEDEGHIEGGPPFQAEIKWGELADEEGDEGTDPVYNAGDDPRCSDTYCHGGGFVEGDKGTLTDPIWTTVDGSQSACGTCHLIPPHADFGVGCEICHGSVVAPDTTITESGKGLHINGQVDF